MNVAVPSTPRPSRRGAHERCRSDNNFGHVTRRLVSKTHSRELTLFRSYAYNADMARPKKERCVGCEPNSCYFKPKGIPIFELQEVSLTLDELEALRLADYLGRYHEDAAKEMKISRATFGRIVSDARRKVAEALVLGKALKIESAEGTSPASATPKGKEKK
jgi:predicted DNA-binding protein (UPF0251 family)